jgi:hypothetical protein
VKETISQASEGKLPFGSSKRVGIAEGMIDYTHDDPNFLSNVPEEIRSELANWFERLKEKGVPGENE